jgi:hypothetical protein
MRTPVFAGSLRSYAPVCASACFDRIESTSIPLDSFPSPHPEEARRAVSKDEGVHSVLVAILRDGGFAASSG